MKSQEAKFDHATALLLERGGATGAFIRRGMTGEGGVVLDSDQRATFAQRLHLTSPSPSRQMRLSAFLH